MVSFAAIAGIFWRLQSFSLNPARRQLLRTLSKKLAALLPVVLDQALTQNHGKG
jgi:hypothetical protein